MYAKTRCQAKTAILCLKIPLSGSHMYSLRRKSNPFKEKANSHKNENNVNVATKQRYAIAV